MRTLENVVPLDHVYAELSFFRLQPAIYKGKFSVESHLSLTEVLKDSHFRQGNRVKIWNSFSSGTVVIPKQPGCPMGIALAAKEIS